MSILSRKKIKIITQWKPTCTQSLPSILNCRRYYFCILTRMFVFCWWKKNNTQKQTPKRHFPHDQIKPNNKKQVSFLTYPHWDRKPWYVWCDAWRACQWPSRSRWGLRLPSSSQWRSWCGRQRRSNHPEFKERAGKY